VESGLTARPGKTPGSVWVKMHILLLSTAADMVRGIIANNASTPTVDVWLGGAGGAAILSTASLSLREPGAESTGGSGSGSGGSVGAAAGGVVAGLLALIILVALISRGRSRRKKLNTPPSLGAFGGEYTGNGGWQVDNPAYHRSSSVAGHCAANTGPDAPVVQCAALSSTLSSSAQDHGEGALEGASLQAEGWMPKRPVSSVGSTDVHLGAEQSAASAAHGNATSLWSRGRADGGQNLPGTVPDNATNAAANDTDQREVQGLRSNPAYESQPAGAQFQRREPYGLLDNPAYGTARCQQQQTCFSVTEQGAWRHGATLADNPAYLSFADGPSGDSRG